MYAHARVAAAGAACPRVKRMVAAQQACAAQAPLPLRAAAMTTRESLARLRSSSAAGDDGTRCAGFNDAGGAALRRCRAAASNACEQQTRSSASPARLR